MKRLHSNIDEDILMFDDKLNYLYFQYKQKPYILLCRMKDFITLSHDFKKIANDFDNIQDEKYVRYLEERINEFSDTEYSLGSYLSNMMAIIFFIPTMILAFDNYMRESIVYLVYFIIIGGILIGTMIANITYRNYFLQKYNKLKIYKAILGILTKEIRTYEYRTRKIKTEDNRRSENTY